jgi:diguanylate cyclase (GGDEF)-like protein
MENDRIRVICLLTLAFSLLGAGKVRSTPDIVAGNARRLTALTRAHDVQMLSAVDAERGYPVKLRGVITYFDRFDGNLADAFVQDETAGIFVFLQKSLVPSPVHTGQIVEVSGVSTPGDFSPCVANGQIRVLGEGSMPKPKHLIFEELLGAKEDGRWTELEGVVRSGQISTGRLFMNVATHGGTFLAIMPDYPKDWANTLVDAKVALRGVVGAIFNDRRQSVGFRLFVPNPSFIRIEDPSPANPFDLQAVSTVAVGQFRPQSSLERRIRVRGTVTAIEPGAAIYLSDGNGNLEVQSSTFCPAKIRDVLDAVGFPGYVNGRPGLQDAICRHVGDSAGAEAVRVTADEVLPALIEADPSGYGLQAGKRYDARLVSIEGRLLQYSEGPNGYTLVLSAGKRDFSALLPARLMPARSGRIRFETGSRIRLTGVCLVTFDQYRRGQHFRILLRTPEDIVVQEWPPWWNLQRAVWALCLTAFLFLSAITWILVLRRQVAQRTRQLRELTLLDPLTGAANRRHFDETLAAEFERARRSSSPLSLLMVDIDHFKALNDSEGHQRGDAYLRQVVGTLQVVVTRRQDMVARYGGEEFAIILSETPGYGARMLAEDIRVRVEQLAIPNPGRPPGQVLSVSVGVATWLGTDEGSAADLLAGADRALYRAKSIGRNCTVAVEVGARSDVPSTLAGNQYFMVERSGRVVAVARK